MISFNFANVIASSEVYSLYYKMLNNIEKNNDFSLLNPMHTILAGLKTLVCNNSLEATKLVRETCGAAGFSKFSGIGNSLEFLSAYVTLEGDYVVMYL